MRDMSIEYQVVSSEKGKVRRKKSPLEGSAEAERRRGVLTSLFKAWKKSPFDNVRLPAEGGKNRRRRFRGMISEDEYCELNWKTKSTFMESSPRSQRSSRSLIPPLKGDFRAPKLHQSLAALILILSLFTAPVFGQTVDSQTETNSQDTPQIESGTSDSIVSSYPQLEEYLRIAVEENPELRSLNYLYRAEIERSREMGVLPDPELTIKYDFNPMMSESQLGRFSFSAMQMFPWFGSLSTTRDALRSAAEADRAQIDVRQLEILRDLQITWLDIAEIQEQIRITEQNIELIRELISLVEIRYETGGAGQADILRIQMEEQRLQNRIANLKDQLNPLKAEFNEYLNRDSDSQVETTDSLQPQPIQYSDEQIHELVLTQNPTFDAISARESSLTLQNRAAKLGGRPSIGLGLEVMGRDFGPMSMNPNSTESFIGMATIRLPIFRSRTQSQQRQVTERLSALEFDRHQTENRLSTEVERVLEEIRKSERTIRLLEEELVPRAEQAFTILSEAYSVGNARFDELLQIQRELLELEIERVDALAGQNRAVVRMESLIGNSGPPLKGERTDEGGSGG